MNNNQLLITDPNERYEYVRNHINFSDKICPKCGTETIIRELRYCYNCKGHMIWSCGDDGHELIRQLLPFSY